MRPGVHSGASDFIRALVAGTIICGKVIYEFPCSNHFFVQRIEILTVGLGKEKQKAKNANERFHIYKPSEYGLI